MWWIFIILLIQIGDTRKVADILWNSSNPIFDISNTDHVINVQINDHIHIECSDPSNQYEYSMIYMVSEEEYNHCYLSENSRVFGICDNETNQSGGIRHTIRSVNPTPGGFEYKPGNNYYLITTSDGSRDGIDRKKDGLCTERNMKIKLVVGNEHSPKFAARTYTKDSPFSDNNEQVMYVIHDDEDDSSSNSNIYFTLFSALLSLFIIVY
ncbi:unnamed protein product [Caenorhabditis angaria]|uniref:Ephrin RBD domain-containing protein n=1 Tax=Caenorhabditis angaria TaxID=860376 RepID=A0A9P1IQQ4_9PELO|nr:unnamed protein product [Caenorhabditis angaria]